MVKLYLCTTADEYELPLVVADTVNELCTMCHDNKNNVLSAISHGIAGDWKSKYHRIEYIGVDEIEIRELRRNE